MAVPFSGEIAQQQREGPSDESHDRNSPEIAAALQERQAERLDDVDNHGQEKQKAEQFRHDFSGPCEVSHRLDIFGLHHR